MEFEIRAARPSDKEPLMSFIRDVWGGHDYIPRVWDSWLKQKNARMFVVLVGGKQVGMNRIRFMEDRSAWLEGARVHPGYRGRGLATALGNNSMALARERGIKLLRLTSGSRNLHAHRQIDRIGFKESARFSIYSPPDSMQLKPIRGVRKLDTEDHRKVLRTITTSPEYALGSGVIWDTFAASELTSSAVKEALAHGQVYSNGDALAISRQGGEGGDVWSQVCFATGGGEAVVGLLKHIFAGRAGYKVDWSLAYIPQGSRLIRAIRDAGFERQFSNILYERETPKG